MAGFFGEIDVNDIPSGPKAGTYPATIISVDTEARSKAGDKYYIIKYEIHNENFDFPVEDWFRMPEIMNKAAWDNTTTVDAKNNTEYTLNMRNLKFFRIRLEQIGVPPEAVGTIEPQRLVSAPVAVTITLNDSGFATIGKVAPREVTKAAAPSGPMPITSTAQPDFIPTATPAAASAPVNTPAAAPGANPFANFGL